LLISNNLKGVDFDPDFDPDTDGLLKIAPLMSAPAPPSGHRPPTTAALTTAPPSGDGTKPFESLTQKGEFHLILKQ